MNRFFAHYFPRQRVPLLLLFVISLSWSYYYLSNNVLNDYGLAKNEWMLFVDGLIVLPLVCLYCLRENIKLASIKAIAYASLMILLGSFIIPQQQKHIWLYLEELRYVALVLFIFLEITSIATVVISIKAALNTNLDPDKAIQTPINKLLGESALAHLMMFEARVWSYALFPSKIKTEKFEGEKHFHCHLKDGTQSNLLGFILMILIELPILHLILHFTWSASGATYISLATLLGLAYFLAEYRAIAIRPISIQANGIMIRYSVWQSLFIPFDTIKSVSSSSGYIKRRKGIKRYNLSGNPNVIISVCKNNNSKQLIKLNRIYLGLDVPSSFINEFKKASSLQ